MDDWTRLIVALDGWGSAAQVGPGRIAVTLPGSGRRVVVVLTPEDWHEMWSVMWGNVDDAIADVRRALLGLQPHEGFAVYADHGLQPSTEPTLPEDEDLPARPGEWVALDRDGRVTSRFSQWRDPQDDA